MDTDRSPARPRPGGGDEEGAAPVEAGGDDGERLLLRRLGEGVTNAMLAGELAVNERSVRRRITALYNKLGATSRSECLIVAGRLGIL